MKLPFKRPTSENVFWAYMILLPVGIALASAVISFLTGCAGTTVELPRDHCVAHGVTVRWVGGQRHVSTGCIEYAPVPGDPMPPR